MSGIERVDGGAGPHGTEGPERARKTEKAKGDFAAHLDTGSPIERSARNEEVEGNAFATLRERILEGVDQNLARDDILRHVIDDEVARSFGDRPRGDMSAAITSAFQSNDHLKSLFDQIYRAAVRERETD